MLFLGFLSFLGFFPVEGVGNFWLLFWGLIFSSRRLGESLRLVLYSVLVLDLFELEGLLLGAESVSWVFACEASESSRV